MNTLLTIDFDIIMSPSIEMYNTLIGENRKEADTEYSCVQDLIDDYSFSFVNYNADLNIYKIITTYIKQIADKIPKENIFFEDFHDEIYLNHKDIYPIDTIINIDHHHDFGYRGDNINEINLSNWAQYLLKHKQINNYIWVHDIHSNLVSKYQPLENIAEKQLLYDFNIDNYINDIKYICLCKSEPWIPVRYFYLYDLWKELFA